MRTPETSATTAIKGSSSVRDCRVYERHACGLMVSCQPPSARGRDNLQWPAQVRDISQGGLALVLRRRFEKGAGLAVELPGSDPENPSTVLVRVVRVLAQPEGFWLLGCSFVSPLSEDEVRSLMGVFGAAPKQQTTGDIANTAAGQSMVAVVPSKGSRILIGGVQLEVVLSAGRVLRRWVDHLYVRCAWPVSAGGRLVLRTNRGSAGKKGVRLQVESCTRRGESWFVRCTSQSADPTQVACALGLGKRRKKD